MSQIMDLYINKERKDSALEALERVKAAIEERITSRGERQVTVYEALRIAESFVAVARLRYEQAENAYVDAAEKILNKTMSKKKNAI